jgi:hypothetical protein
VTDDASAVANGGSAPNMSKQPSRPADEPRRGAHNEIEYRNVDEEAEYDERGRQGAGDHQPEEANEGSRPAE